MPPALLLPKLKNLFIRFAFYNFARRLAGDVLAETVLFDDVAPQPRAAAGNKPLTVPGSPKPSNEGGLARSRFLGPDRAFSIAYANFHEEHIELSGKLPFPTGNGARSRPEDVREAARFIAGKGRFGKAKLRDLSLGGGRY